MHIKQIIIQGFKSYKDQTVVDPFSPKHNVIIGRNGSGKSNFFAAIRFVLGDQYTQMGREERNALLHEGTGSAVMSAYVEIIFDNSDDRFPTNTPEVVLRRSIGLKKDEYTLNRKNTTKTEVLNLLESAGFSRSNPYYIVPQGRITHITNMKDYERLSMLKEVAGTQVYEQRRAESVRIMHETENSRQKTDETLTHIRERLEELKEETNELNDYLAADRERRCLEYTIYHREQEALQEALDRLEGEREGGIEQTDDSQTRLREAEAQLEKLEVEVSELQTNLKLLATEKAQFEVDRNEAAKEKAAVEYEVQALLDGQQAAQSNRKQYATELRDVKSRISEREAELANIQPQSEKTREQAQTLQQQIREAESTRQLLLSKQGRSARYRSKRERDDDLKQQITQVSTQLRSRESATAQYAREANKLEEQIQQLEAEIAVMRDRLDNRGDEQQTISAQTQSLKDEKEKLNDRRKGIWREEAKLDSLLANARQEMDKAEQFLNKMMDQNTSRGLAAMRQYVQQHNIQGVHGTVGELVEFSDKYKTAVEVTAGASLFHVIVDTDETATRLVELLQKDKAGRVTFMPLNRLHPKSIDLPSGADAIPLLARLKFDERYTKAYEQIFGKTVICPDLRAASHYARSHGVSAITPGGDRSNKKGALSGGYHDTRSSRTNGLRRAKAARDELDDLTSRQSELQREREALDQQITKSEVFTKRDELQRKQIAKNNSDDNYAQLQQQLDEYQKELGGVFTKALTDDEEQQLKVISESLPAAREQYAQVNGEATELESRKKDIEVELRENLRLRLDQLRGQDVEGHEDSGDNARLKERNKDHDRAVKKLKTWNDRLREQTDVIDQTQQQLHNQEAARAEQQKVAEDMTRAIANVQKTLQKSAQKKRTVQARLDEVAASIRALGALPDAAFNAPYSTMQNQTATLRLHKAQDALKKFGHVNKKAFEQFAQFNKDREKLEDTRRELGNGDASIRALIEHLDQQKDEAIERTFRQVSKEFARMFEKLVPAGKGRLIIQRRADNTPADDASDDEDRNRSGAVENYTGVGISVSFNSKHDEQQRIQQLSGGQKSLCALTLIFAIQASDPAPFYLFDEIDANLDAQYRTAVADLIEESAETGQFICTTFRPEMLRVADKCYGVSSSKKASYIKPVTTEEALEFVEGQVSAN
ncbi:hypothetical protein AMS68_001080 [Peltaster fructicola]|uniref:Structural maintenance of chromosomes protein n=1 Tax=Peltaster fructicola TaxID=286661 RepID=A0A6H0XLG9_9PEZI|nr:hypothetical protein AMS68_001080 [Peltaster fructicola]